MKRTLSLIFAVIMVVLSVPMTAVEVVAEKFTEGRYTYSVENGEATITDVAPAISGDVVIPDALGGYPVISIDYMAFFYCESLTDVYYGGSKNRWNSISIGTDNDCLTDATIHFAELDSGDVSGDGKVNLMDVSLIMKYIAKWDVVLGK